MEQTRVFGASIIMFWGRVRRASSYPFKKVNMGSIRKPRNESNKAMLARITKEMAQPRIAKSARKGGESTKSGRGRGITDSRRSHFLVLGEGDHELVRKFPLIPIPCS
jgi:hypothetical protein